VGDRRTLYADGLEAFRHLVIQGGVCDLLPSAGAGGWRGPGRGRPHQEQGAIPAPAVEEIRERLLGDGAVERLANSPKKIEDKHPLAGVGRESMFKRRIVPYAQPGKKNHKRKLEDAREEVASGPAE
jgi:hypothetical protein